MEDGGHNVKGDKNGNIKKEIKRGTESNRERGGVAHLLALTTVQRGQVFPLTLTK